MYDSNMNFVLLQTTSKSIIVVENLDRFLTEKSTVVSLFVDIHIYFSLCDFLAFKTLKKKKKLFGAQALQAFLSCGVYFPEHGELEPGRDQQADDCESELTEPGYKIGHHELQMDGDRRCVGNIRSRLGNNATLNTHLFFFFFF